MAVNNDTTSTSANSQYLEKSIESSSLKLTFKTFWSDYIFSLAGNQRQWQLCAIPWGFTPLDDKGELVKEAYERINKILEASQFEVSKNTLIYQKAIVGQAFMAWNIIENEIYGKLPIINVASNAARWVQPIGQPLELVDLVQYYQLGTQPIITTTQYRKDKITNTYKEDQQSKIVTTVETIENTSGIIPVQRFSNPSTTASLNGISFATSEFIKQLAYRADAIWDKILDYMVSNTNLVATPLAQTSFSTPTDNLAQKESVKETMHKTAISYTLNNQFVDGRPFQIVKGDFNIEPLWNNLVQILMLISWFVGGVPIFDRLGSYQITDTQRYTANRNSTHLILSQEVSILKQQMLTFLRMLEKVDKEYDWKQVKHWIIDIPFSEAGIDLELLKNPIAAYQAGYSPIQMIKTQHKVSEAQARLMLEELEKAPEKYPNFYSLIGIGNNKQNTDNKEQQDKTEQNNLIEK